MLMLRTQAGFCNRIRAIVSGVLWAEDLGRKLAIYWPVEIGHMPCALEELLCSDSIPHLCCVHAGYLSKAHQVSSEDDMKGLLKFAEHFDELRIESYSAFHPETAGARGLVVLRGLRLHPMLEESAAKLWETMGGCSTWTGIHIRGTDNVKCLETSPVEAFLNFVHKEDSSQTTYYLATDDDSIKDAFHARKFQSRIVCLTIPQGRERKEQQQAAVLEWLLLQKCHRILASKGSTFSEWASLRSGSTLVEVVA